MDKFHYMHQNKITYLVSKKLIFLTFKDVNKYFATEKPSTSLLTEKRQCVFNTKESMDNEEF